MRSFHNCAFVCVHIQVHAFVQVVLFVSHKRLLALSIAIALANVHTHTECTCSCLPPPYWERSRDLILLYVYMYKSIRSLNISDPALGGEGGVTLIDA